jgi:hypothetical protein
MRPLAPAAALVEPAQLSAGTLAASGSLRRPPKQAFFARSLGSVILQQKVEEVLNKLVELEAHKQKYSVETAAYSK